MDPSQPSPSSAAGSPPREPEADGEEVLDATVADDAEPPSLTDLPSRKYDPDEFRDQARKNITYWLLVLLTLLFAGAFAVLFLVDGGRPTFDHLKALLEILLGPLVALVSAATGFYFGAQSGMRRDDQR